MLEESARGSKTALSPHTLIWLWSALVECVWVRLEVCCCPNCFVIHTGSCVTVSASFSRQISHTFCKLHMLQTTGSVIYFSLLLLHPSCIFFTLHSLNRCMQSPSPVCRKADHIMILPPSYFTVGIVYANLLSPNKLNYCQIVLADYIVSIHLNACVQVLDDLCASSLCSLFK